MTEVVYVWELKQALNKITRKMRKLKEAAETRNVDAMLAMQYSYLAISRIDNCDEIPREISSRSWAVKDDAALFLNWRPDAARFDQYTLYA
jgi:hypothetical protein